MCVDCVGGECDDVFELLIHTACLGDQVFLRRVAPTAKNFLFSSVRVLIRIILLLKPLKVTYYPNAPLFHCSYV